MNTLTWTKRIHKTLRDAGYNKPISVFQHGPKFYKTYVDMLEGKMVVYIPGNWSITLRKQFRMELLEVLKEFNTEVNDAHAGVTLRNI